MSWQCIELTVSCDKEVFFSELFAEFDALSITTMGADDTQVFEIDGQADDNWQLITLTALFDSQANLDDLLRRLAQHQPLGLVTKELEDRDWERAWLENYKPQKVSEKLWICPSWLEPVDVSAINIIIDPGMSFGTGTHQSTRLCLQWLSEMDIDDLSVIDYGCGSGILAIAALKLGAKNVFATDIEARSLAATLENADKNDIGRKIKTSLAQDMPELKADLVIANILAGTLISLAQVLTQATKVNGQLLLAGILNTQEQSVMDAYADFDWQSRNQDDWVALLGTRQR